MKHKGDQVQVQENPGEEGSSYSNILTEIPADQEELVILIMSVQSWLQQAIAHIENLAFLQLCNKYSLNSSCY